MNSTGDPTTRLGGQGRPWPHEAHLAAHDVPELWQLVDGHPADEPSDPRDARVVLHLEHRPIELVPGPEVDEQARGIGDHRAELEHLERLATAPEAALAEEDAAGRCARDDEGDHRHGDGQEEESRRRDDHVEGTLGEGAPTVSVHGLDVEDGVAAERADADATRLDIGQRRGELDVQPGMGEDADEAVGRVEVERRGGDDDTGRTGGADRIDDPGDEVEGLVGLVGAGKRRHHTEDLVAEAAVALEHPDDRTRLAVLTDHDDPPRAAPGRATAAEEAAQHLALGVHEGQREREGEKDPGTADIGLQEEADRRHADHGEGQGIGQSAELVGAAGDEPRLVEAARCHRGQERWHREQHHDEVGRDRAQGVTWDGGIHLTGLRAGSLWTWLPFSGPAPTTPGRLAS
ncbi:MAG: hypothetical protein JJE52_16950 [Acidimicrobiia bacterium]|nr:hypothetical protein [Acidimicrobiia bacterium]